MQTGSRLYPLVGASIGLLVALAAPAWAQTVVPAQSEIAFTSKQMGVPVEGKFKKWGAKITLDPKSPEAGKVSFTVDTGSASFGSPETDAEMPKAAWFNSARFPQATFQSSAIKKLGPGKLEVSGKLDIKGMSQSVTVPVTVTQTGSTSVASGAFVIKRLDFKIGEGEWSDTSMVANDVHVKFKLALTELGAF